MLESANLAAIIPCLNEQAAIASVVRDVRSHVGRVYVVDDGSSDATAARASEAGAEVIRHPTPRGKGAALQTGCMACLTAGYTTAILLDGDGQHDPADIPAFVECARRTGSPLVVGNRMGDNAAMPAVRRFVNAWMSRRLSEIASQSLPDSQCGFRLMDLRVWSALGLKAANFEIESEVLLAFAGAGHRVEFVPIKVIYGAERSKINPLIDTIRWFRWLRSRTSHKPGE